MSARPELREWLDIATRGLPRSIKARIYDELAAHYEDAFSEQFALVGDTTGAHVAALTQLGDARLIGQGLRATHLRRQRYLWATLITILSLLWLILGAFFLRLHPLIHMFISLGCMVYILNAFQRLLGEQVNPPRLTLAIRLIVVATLIAGLVGIVGDLDIRRYPSAFLLNDPFIIPRPDLYMQEFNAYHLILALSVAAAGIGWLLLCERLYDQRESLYQLAPLLRISLFGVGLGLLGSAVGLLARNVGALTFFSLVMIGTSTARNALLALLFFRASRYPTPPLQRA